MKPSITLFVLTTILLLTILLLPEMLTAQAPPSLPAKPTQNPIDGGLALLAIAGGAYAYKKLARRSLSDPRSLDAVDDEGDLLDRKK